MTCRSRPGVDLSPAHQPVYVFPLCDATTHNGVVTSGQTICHQYWLCFLLYDCSIEEEKKQTIKNVQHVVCVCLSRHSIACAPGPCNPSWTLFLYYMMKTFTSSPTTTTLVFSSIFLCYVYQKKMNKKIKNRRKDRPVDVILDHPPQNSLESACAAHQLEPFFYLFI